MKRREPAFALILIILSLGLGACDLVDKLLDRSLGEKTWRRNCAECHGIDGSGNTPGYMGETYADLRDDLWRAGGNDGAFEAVIVGGVFGKMPPTRLTAEELRAVISYIHELRGEKARGTSN
ncbi:MAG: cytochrome c [Acidobacteriota bacterium]